MISMDVRDPDALQALHGGICCGRPQEAGELAEGALATVQQQAALRKQGEVQGRHIAVLAGDGCAGPQEAHLQQLPVGLHVITGGVTHEAQMCTPVLMELPMWPTAQGVTACNRPWSQCACQAAYEHSITLSYPLNLAMCVLGIKLKKLERKRKPCRPLTLLSAPYNDICMAAAMTSLKEPFMMAWGQSG